MKMGKKICIIGGGASGLTAIKCCLDEDLEPVCFERTGYIGGLWRYVEEKTTGACVYKSTIINTSKEMMCFSDYPIPENFPNFMHNTRIVEYFRMYAKEFNLEKYIQLQTEVLSCKQADNHEESGKWIVKHRNIATCDEAETVFDGVIVAIGHHALPYLPLESFQYFDKFGGGHMHSHDYRTPNGLEDKRVLVVGIGNSGGDISVELSRVAKQVFLSTRSGAWVLNRVNDNGLPLDIVQINRFSQFLRNSLPDGLVNTVGEMIVNSRFDHEIYGLRPKHRFFGQHPMVNDDLPNRILNGSIIVKGNVQKFTENGVYFEDGEFREIDFVIFATGYNFTYPFLDESIVNVKKNEAPLYKYVWPPNVKKGTLAIIGGVQPMGAVNPISELQCRWITRVFKGLAKLPSKEEMISQINAKADEMRKRYYATQRHTVQVDYVSYMDEIASEIGVKPNLLHLTFTDPKLSLKVFFGPCTPYQFRLHGPGRWSKARDMIMTQNDRVLFPLKTRPSVATKKPGHVMQAVLVLLVAFIVYVIIY